MGLRWLWASAVVLSGCTLAVDPAPPVAPVPLISQAVEAPVCPLETVQVVVLGSPSDPSYRPLARPPVPTKGARGLRPEAVVAQAQKAARIEPTERGYFGTSAEQVYTWAAGKIYTIYLSKQQGTGIFLPPGDKLLSGLFLDPEAYDVKQMRAGSGERAYDTLVIHPLIDTGEVQAFLLTESGRRYLLHFVVGKTAMVGVTFDGARAEPAP